MARVIPWWGAGFFLAKPLTTSMRCSLQNHNMNIHDSVHPAYRRAGDVSASHTGRRRLSSEKDPKLALSNSIVIALMALLLSPRLEWSYRRRATKTERQ